MVPNRAKHHIFENRDTKAMNIDIPNLYFEHLYQIFLVKVMVQYMIKRHRCYLLLTLIEIYKIHLFKVNKKDVKQH